MKKTTLLKAVLATLFLAFPTLRALAYSSCVANDDGVDIYYAVVSEDEMTVEVTYSAWIGLASYDAETITVPETVELTPGEWDTFSAGTYTVIGIGEGAFSYCPNLKSVNFPSSITYIADEAFSNCTSLEWFDIPSNITSIEDGTFSGCESFTSITIPSTITSIGSRAFSSCTGLTSVTLSEGLTSIGDDAFIYCGSLNSITLPSTLETIGNEAFYGCESLTTITIPSGVTSIGDSAFANCSNLAEINVDNNAYYSSVDGVLYNSDKTVLLLAPAGFSATTYTVPSTVKTIDGYAFYGCSGLTSIEIPESVTSVGNYAFAECTGLTSIELSDSVTSMGYFMFSDCTNLVSAKLPGGLTSIENGTFGWCESLKSIEIPDGVTNIGLMAFNGCSSLTSIEIPAGVTNIGVYAFQNCTGLDSITSLNPEPPVCEYYAEEGDYTFYNVDKTACVLIVPYEAREAYAEADVWKEFVNIVEMDPPAEDEQGDDTAGISAVAVDGQTNVSGYYTIDGKQVSAPAKGVNIVKFADGTTKKVLAK